MMLFERRAHEVLNLQAARRSVDNHVEASDFHCTFFSGAKEESERRERGGRRKRK